VAVEHRVHALLQPSGVDSVLKRKLKSSTSSPGNDVARAGAGVDVADLPAGGREELVAFVPARGHQLGQRRRQLVDRVARQLRVGDVALDALDE
jgi:hypothetical protein